MPDRSSTAVTADEPTAQVLERMGQGLAALVSRLRRVETWSNQIAPAGMRFEREVDDAGAWLVVVEVRTGNRERIAGPL
jgi:hypothetical protein